jgi:photosystem II stability/assembly factor-like uncharacterized protein
MTDWPLNPSACDDCQLTRIHFSDSQAGWAVGQRGLVLATDDGGSNWVRQDLGITCDLYDVVFVSPAHGWIAGGFRVPHASTSHGVLLETLDGGRTWNPVPGLDLPRIQRLMMRDTGEGYAIGDCGPTRPGGIFKTTDGGHSWSGALDADRASWHTAAMSPAGRVVLAGRGGQLAHTRDVKYTLARRDDAGRCAVNSICFVDGDLGFAVGDGAGVLQTDDGGQSWHAAAIGPAWPPAAVDFAVISQAGDRLWIGGNPGGQIFRYDAGQSGWIRLSLPVSSPLTDIEFINSQSGWATSLLGDILHTTDGGDSWTVQRRGARGTALLQLADDASGLSPELFARFCAEQGFVGGAILFHDGLESSPVSPDDCTQALGRVGGSFLIPAPRSLGRSAGDQHTEAARLPDLHAYLVRQIRTLQPRVLSIAASRHPLGGIDWRGEIMAAVADAANPTCLPDLESSLGLSAWQVSKVLALDRSGAGDIVLSSSEYLPQISCLAGDLAVPSRALLGQPVDLPGALSFSTIYTSPLVTGQGSSLMDAVERSDSRVPRRKPRRSAAGNLLMTRQLANKQKQLDALINLTGDSRGVPADFGNRLASLCGNLDDATSGVWLYQLGQELLRRGDTALARLVFVYLTDQYGRHPLALSATLRLFDDLSSAEMTHIARQQLRLARTRLQEQPIAAGEAPETAMPLTRPVQRIENGVATTVWEAVEIREAAVAESPVQQISYLDEQLNRLDSVRWQQAWSVSQSISVLDPGAFDTPLRSLARVRLNALTGPHISPEPQLKLLAAVDPLQSVISAAALRELLVVRQGPAEAARRFGAACPGARSRPWLDGILDDSVWADSKAQGGAFSLVDSAGRTIAEVTITADGEFLFLCGDCPRLAGVPYRESDAPRTKNADLSGSDRITIRLDCDRDYLTAFEFSIDSSGAVNDQCGMVRDWDPRWYVATRLDERRWCFEAAIPLAELCDPGCPPLWSFSFTRYVRNAQAATWWQAKAAGVASSARSGGLAALDDGAGSEFVNPDAWAMVLMPWEPSTPEAALPGEPAAGQTAERGGTSIQRLPDIR